MDDTTTKAESEVVEDLKAAFQSDSVDERVRAAMNCIECPSAAVAEILLRQLTTDSSAFVRATIVKSLATVAPGQHLEALLTVFDDEDDRVRSNAFEALEQHPPSAETLSYAFRHLHDPSARVRGNARDRLEACEPAVRASTVEHMLSTARADFQVAALLYLERGDEDAIIDAIGTGRLVELVAPLCEVLNSKCRFHAMAVLKRLAAQGVAAAQTVIAGFGDNPPWDGDGPPPTFVTESRENLDPATRRGRLYHPEAEKRLAEISAIVAASDKAALPLLRERCVVEEDALVIKSLLDGLRQIGGSQERSFLVGYLAAGPMPVRHAAIEALGALGDDESLDALEPYTGHENIQLRAAAAAVLAARGRLDGEAFIKELVDAGDRDSLLCALMTIRRSPEPLPFHDLLVSIHDDAKDEMVRNYAQETERLLLRRGMIATARVS